MANDTSNFLHHFLNYFTRTSKLVSSQGWIVEVKWYLSSTVLLLSLLSLSQFFCWILRKVQIESVFYTWVSFAGLSFVWRKTLWFSFQSQSLLWFFLRLIKGQFQNNKWEAERMYFRSILISQTYYIVILVLGLRFQ